MDKYLTEGKLLVSLNKHLYVHALLWKVGGYCINKSVHTKNYWPSKGFISIAFKSSKNNPKHWTKIKKITNQIPISPINQLPSNFHFRKNI